MSFWEFLWMIFKAGLFVCVGIPVFIVICLFIILIFI